MNKSLKKYVTKLFGVSLVIWFTTSIYLSFSVLLGLFVDTNPYIAKFTLAFSFLLLIITGTYNYVKTGDFNSLKNNSDITIGNRKGKPKSQCRTCKKT